MTVEEQRTMQAIQNINRKLPDVELRDLFAMNSLNTLLQKPIESFEVVAKQSYLIADAMLEARKK
jgi:hypothetical protein